MTLDVTVVLNCPACKRLTKEWRERPAYGSRELYWVGCMKGCHLAGGISRPIAVQNWNRMAHRIQYEITHKKFQ